MSSPTSEEFRAVMARFATGVTVMTTLVDGEPHGMTANAVSSVSLDPLLVLVCVERDAAMCGLVDRSGIFSLSILAADQVEVSNRFADPSRPSGAAQFADGLRATPGSTGAPRIDGAVGWIDCRVWRTYDGGDHLIVVGEVEALDTGDDHDALVYFRSGYTTTARPSDPPR